MSGGATRVVVSGGAKTESCACAGKRAPSRFRLPPSDIADLRYVFCEMETEAGVRSLHGRMAEAKAKEPPRRAKEAPTTRTGKRRKSSLPSEQMLAAVRELAGDEVAIRPEDVAVFRMPVGRRGSSGAEDLADEKPHGSFSSVAVVVLPPSADAMAGLSREPPEVDTSTRATVLAGDGRWVTAYAGVAPRRFPPSGGRMFIFPRCRGDEGHPADGMLAIEAWADFAQPREGQRVDPRVVRHARARVCRRALLRMEESGGALHVVALHLAYGHRAPGARSDRWDPEIAGLIGYTPTARALHAEAIAKLAGRRVEQMARVGGAAARATDVLVLDAEAAAARLQAAAAAREHAIATWERAAERMRGRLAEATDPEEIAALRDKLAARQAQQDRRRRALCDAHARLAGARAVAQQLRRLATAPMSAPVREMAASVAHAAARFELRAIDVVRERLSGRIERRDGETDASFAARLQAARDAATQLTRTLAREAEQLLVEASHAYRRAREGV